MARFAELLCRSNYSFLRGASHPEELVERAAQLGLDTVGIADLDGVYGLPKAYWKAKQQKGLRLASGAQLTLEGKPGLVLHAKNRQGWGLLCRLLTASHAGKPKGEAGLGWQAFLDALAAGPKGGLLALPLDPQILGEPGGGGAPSRAEDNDFYGPLKEHFGADLFLPLGRFLDGQDWTRDARANYLSQRFGLPLLATSQPHYHDAARRPLQDVLACTRLNIPLGQAGTRLFSNGERRLKSPDEMALLFGDRPELLAASLEAAQRCGFTLAELRYRYPSEWIPAGETGQSWLEFLTWEGAERRFPQGVPADVKAQVERELALIARLGYADYFLTIWELVDFARSKRILCQGRGSAANSAVCFCLGITSVDPVRTQLLFERFLSVERAEPPDIDVDFEHERREEVIQHLYERYGRDRAAMVAAVISYRSRSALFDVTRALGDGQRAQRSLRDLDFGSQPPLVQSLVAEVKGFPRHLSIHSGGFVLSGEPLVEIVPVEPARMEGRTIIQWDKYDLDYVGLMKVDVLALGMLSALRRGMDLAGYADLADLPAEDPETYAMIQRADTVGVFQIESRAQMSMLGRLKPERFYDLVIQVAIVRPGPIVGQMVHPYLRRRRGLEEVRFEHPKLKPILERTLGVPLFQEQVMRIAIELAGFSGGEADELRRAIGAWRSDGRLSAVLGRLRAGLRAQGLSEAFCEHLEKELHGFAEYGFPESHAASFALLAYASSYLRCRHPAAFTAALINSQPMGFYSTHSLVDDAKLHGTEVRPLDPNSSLWDCTLEDGALRLGWRVLKGLGRPAAEQAIWGRPYEDFDDFVRRSGLSHRLLRALALGGAFKGFGLSRRQALWQLLALQSLVQARKDPQLSLMDSLQLLDAQGPDLPLPPVWKRMEMDYETFGLSPWLHPMAALRPYWGRSPGLTAAQARAQPHGTQVKVAGMVIVRQRPGTAKNVVFSTLEDETGLLDLVLWLDVYERYRDAFLEHGFLRVWGELQRDGDAISVLVSRLESLPLPGDETPPLSLNRAHNWH
jgi:error-prone DNA polymerase